MAEVKTELRTATKRGYTLVPGGGWRLVEKGEQVMVPASLKAKWLTKPKAAPTKAPAKPEPKTEGSAE